MIFFWPFIGLSLLLIFLNYNFNYLSLIIFLLVAAIMVVKKEKVFLISLVGGAVLGLLLFYLLKRTVSGQLDELGIVVKSEENYFLLRTLKGVFYVKYKGNPFEIGDVLSLSGTVSDLAFTHYQESFDFEKYLNSQSAFQGIEDYSIQIKFSNFIRLNQWKDSFLEGYSDQSKILISGLVFNSSLNDLNSYGSLKNIGLASLISASGIHIGAIQSFLKKILEKKLPEKVISGLLLAFIIIIFLIDGFPLSIFRILIMNILTTLISFKKIPSLSYVEKLSISGMIILFLNSFYVLNIGFFYTYLVLMIFGFLRGLIKYREKWQRLKRSAYFGIAVLPLNLIVNYSVSPLTILVQFIFSTLISFMFCLDLLVFFKSLTRPFLDRVNYLFLQLFSLSSKIDFVFVSGKISVVVVIFLYLLLAVFMVLKELNFKKVLKIFSLSMAGVVCLLFLPDIRPYYEVHFIDVGQGDSTLIRYKDKNILIDTGGSIYVDLALNCLIPYLQSLKIGKLDGVLTTHDDYDHVGALDSLKANFQIENVYKGGDQKQYKFGDLLIEDLNQFKVDGAESNYNSAVYSFKIYNTSFLIMGDAPIQIEKRIIETYPNLSCDLLKLGHHGSSTSTCEDFLRFKTPDKVVISCGLNNLYKHPSESVMKTIKSLSIPYFRTDYQGTLVYKIPTSS